MGTSIPVNTDRICDFIPTDTQYAWLSWGPNFEVIRTTNGAKVAAWTFGAVLHHSKTRVTCVTELPCNDGSGRISQFVVGLECELVGGMICVFDIRGSKVLRAIQMPSKVCERVITNILILFGFEVLTE